MTNITTIRPDPAQADFMTYAPAVKITGEVEPLYLSGQTASLLYHQHPHVPEEHILPHDIESQTRQVMENIKITLDHEGLTWRNIVRVDKYITDIREADAMHGIMNEYFGDWRPAGTLLGVNNLSSPAARVELTMIAVNPIDH